MIRYEVVNFCTFVASEGKIYYRNSHIHNTSVSNINWSRQFIELLVFVCFYTVIFIRTCLYVTAINNMRAVYFLERIPFSRAMDQIRRLEST